MQKRWHLFDLQQVDFVLLSDAILLFDKPVVSGSPILLPALVRVAVFDIDNELSIMSELASVIVAVVVAIFIYLFIYSLIINLLLLLKFLLREIPPIQLFALPQLLQFLYLELLPRPPKA
jgi:hypothetical protein